MEEKKLSGWSLGAHPIGVAFLYFYVAPQLIGIMLQILLGVSFMLYWSQCLMFIMAQVLLWGFETLEV